MDKQSNSTGVPTVSIAGVDITTDSKGRFNLNALHKASGLGQDKAPSNWLRNKQTTDLVRELENETMQICVVTIEGRNGGTFADELLAVSYAGWISPAFQLQVNRAFLESRSAKATAPAMPTTAEMFMQSAQILLNIERRQDEQAQALVGVDDRLKRVEDTAPLLAKPQNTETLSDVRHRINRKYGLPPRIVDFVLMKITYKIRPFGMVKNSHEEAQGSSFAVYHSIDVTNLFKRFVRECVQETATMAVHPEIEGRFKLIRPE